MSAGSETGGMISRPHLRSLQSDLVGAHDRQILKVVAMVDKLPVRGDADQFIAPLRQRLAALRPARPVNFTRLLFMPLDPVIVAPANWKRDALAVPRSALLPLSNQVRAALGADTAALDLRIAPLTSGQGAELRAIGAVLWPRAVAVLSASQPPEDWAAATGLQSADYRAIADHVTAALGSSGGIEALA